jgi:arginyl-tRNA synthetase
VDTLYTQLYNSVLGAVDHLKTEGFLPSDINEQNIVLENPKDKSHGDYATNAAMVLAKPAGKSPRDVAEKIKLALANDQLIAQIDIAGPGFINLTINANQFANQLKEIITDITKFSSSEVGKNQKVLVEFVSANPTGPLHFGHARGAIYGDVLCRLMAKAGYDVAKEYLINDAGVQVNNFAVSVMAAYYGIEDDRIQYKGKYVSEAAEAAYEQLGSSAFPPKPHLDSEGLPEVTDEIVAAVVQHQMKIIGEDLELAGIHFKSSEFFSEKTMHLRGEADDAEQEMREKGLIYEGILPPPKGKEVSDYQPVELTLFKAKEFGDDEDRPIKKQDGSWTYFGSDVAYHVNKINRGYNHLINLWGADHAGAVKRLKSAVSALTGTKDALEIQLMQMVRLFRGGEPVKMSKRAGVFVTFREVVEEVGVDAVRFILLTRKADSQLDFDLEKVIEKNNDNPVFYVQYAYARMCSIFRQMAEMDIQEAKDYAQSDMSLLTSPEETALIRELCDYPMLVAKAALAREPHRLAFYASEIAGKFHSWYNAEKFLVEEDINLTHARLALVIATQKVLKDILDIMGVDAPEKM